MYLNEINFETSKRRQHRFISKIKNYIDILESPEAITHFKHADEVDILLAYLEDIYSKNTHVSKSENIKNQQAIIEICEKLSQLSPNHDATYWYWGDALFALAKLEEHKNNEIYLNMAESKYLISIDKDASEDINIKARKLYELYRYLHKHEKNPKTKNNLLNKALDSLNKSHELSLEKARIHSLLEQPELAINYLQKLTFKKRSNSFFQNLFSILELSLDKIITDPDFKPIENAPSFQAWIKQKELECMNT